MSEGKKQRKPKEGGSWKQFWSFFRKVKLSWGWIILSLAVSIVYYAVVTMIPGSTAALYAGDFTTAAIMGLVINYAGTLVLSLASALSQLMADAKSVRAARNSVWKQMMGIETSYYSESDPGRLLSAVTSDTEAAVSALIRLIIGIPSLGIYLMMCMGQISAYHPKLLGVLFVLVPVYILYAVFMGRWVQKTGYAIQSRIGGLTGFLTERIRNLALIKSFATESKEEAGGVTAAADLYKAKVQYQYINGIVGSYTFFTEAVGIIIAVIWGSTLLKKGEIELEAWLAFYLFVPMINTVLRQFSAKWTEIKELQGRAARLGRLMEAPQEGSGTAASKDIPQGDVAFQNVHFGYAENRKILSDIEFVIPQGKTTAIVGVSGSGKTTILKLLERLYTPGSGSITVGGKDIGELDLHSWRDSISYVNQDAAVFSGTVRDCLTYGIARQVTTGELEQVTKLSGIYDYIMRQKGGFDAQLAIWGSALSGGQRQRLVIARELLKNADILLLDEPTSALDPEAAQAVSDTFFSRFKGKTIVTVTHELNFIAGADQIIVMNQGRIEGQGSHRELMQNCPIYRELVEEQSYQEVFA